MQRASPATVLGDFDGASFEHGGVRTVFRREPGKDGSERFVVETEGPDGARGSFEIAYTFGVDPLQQYLVPFPDGRLQALTVAWDTERRRWLSLYPDDRTPPGDPLHWTGVGMRWNTMCAECHSTALERGYDVGSGRYLTTRVALDVSCQACHGPAASHVRWATGLEPGAAVAPEADRQLATDLVRGTAARELDTCAPCHSRRRRVSARAVPGEPFLDHYAPALLREDLYHVDGQIDAEVYVYGSFLQSRMHAAGVRCSDCHDPHTLSLRAPGNSLCTRCHAPEPDPRFGSLTARDYDSEEHHFHTPGSAGSACVACHMPAKTYMRVDPRRDHSLRVPRPDLSVALGAPNACTGCHSDRDARWAADFLAARPASSARAPQDHFATALAAARAGSADAAARLRALASDAARPGIARATALAMLGAHSVDRPADPETSALLESAAVDADPIVRMAAAGALEAVAPAVSVPALARLVNDPLRAVRVEAARVLSGLERDRLSQADRDAFVRALDEYRDGQAALSDTPQAHLNLGVLALRRGRPAAAEKSYRTAIRLQPDFIPTRINLANLLNAQGRNDEAEAELRAAIAASERLGDDPSGTAARAELAYSLGLLLAETGRLDEAARSLDLAARSLPGRARVHYNHGLVLQHLGRPDEARAALAHAADVSPGEAAFQHALAVLYAQAGEREEALRHARKAAQLSGGAAEARAFLRQIESLRPAP